MSLSLEHVPLFQVIATADRERIGKRLRRQTFPVGAALFEGGEPATTLYIIEEGYVRLLDRNNTEIATLTSGGMVGDIDMLLGRSYLTTSIAIGEVSCWSLQYDDLVELVNANPALGLALSKAMGKRILPLEGYLLNALQALPGFDRLDLAEQQSFVALLQPYSIMKGQTLFAAGDTPKFLYLLEEGDIRLSRRNRTGQQEVITPNRGEALNLFSFLSGRPEEESAQAAADTMLWRVQRDAFLQLDKTYPAVAIALSSTAHALLSQPDRSIAMTKLRQVPMFQSLGENELSVVVDRLLWAYAPPGRALFRAGAVGDALYFVHTGEVEIRQPKEDGALPVARLLGGNFFGEMEVLTGQPHAVDAIAVLPTVYWLLYRQDLDELAVRYPAIGMQLNSSLEQRLGEAGGEGGNRLQKFALFKGMTRAHLQAFLRILQADRYDPGEVIMRAGQPAKAAFIIDSGKVQLQGGGGQATFRNGDVFGLEETLQQGKYVTTATAAEKTDVFLLGPAALRQAIFQYPVLAYNISRLLSERVLRLSTVAPATVTEATARVTRSAPTPVKRAARPAKTARLGLLERFGVLPSVIKLELAVATLLLVWLVGIALPSTIVQKVHQVNTPPAQVITLQKPIGNSPASYPLLPPSTAPTPTYTPMPTPTAAP